MNTYLSLLVVVCAMVGCSSENAENIAEQSEPILSYMAWNGTTNLPSSLTYFCHPTFISGSGAHSQSVIVGGVPMTGGFLGGDTNSIVAVPNNGQTPYQGSMIETVQCNRWTDFHGNSSAGYSQEWPISYSNSGMLEWVGGAQLLEANSSACYLSSMSSLSDSREYVSLDVPNGWQWNLNVGGFRAVSGGARCAHLGRPMSYNGGWLDARPGVNSGGTFSTSSGTCLIYEVDGSIDDGTVLLDQSGGVWTLKVTGSVTRAQAYCFTY